MGVAAPRMRAEFMLDNAQMAWAFSAAILGTLPGAILGGRFADIVGRKKILILVSYFWNYVFANRLSILVCYYSFVLYRFGNGWGATHDDYTCF